MTITVLGPGCKGCAALADATHTAVTQLGFDAEIEKVTDYAEIARVGVMSTPALAIDGKLVMSGRVPTVEQLKDLLSGAV